MMRFPCCSPLRLLQFLRQLHNLGDVFLIQSFHITSCEMFWIVSQAFLTNNKLTRSFHCNFNAFILYQYPIIWKLLSSFLKEQSVSDSIYVVALYEITLNLCVEFIHLSLNVYFLCSIYVFNSMIAEVKASKLQPTGGKCQGSGNW